MPTQPEALRLADAIDPLVRQFAPDHLTSNVAAAELRRLHALNAELLEALERLAGMSETFPDELHKDHPDVLDARAAIAKAKGD